MKKQVTLVDILRKIGPNQAWYLKTDTKEIVNPLDYIKPYIPNNYHDLSSEEKANIKIPSYEDLHIYKLPSYEEINHYEIMRFYVKVSKITDGFNEKEFEVIDGKGYGIVDDCGGIYGLCSIFDGESDYFEPIDIDEFDLEETQKYVESTLKIENLHQFREEY